MGTLSNKEIVNDFLKSSRKESIEVVTPEWIKEKLRVHKIKITEISIETGLNITSISAWSNGSRPMGRTVKAFWFFYFKTKTLSKNAES